MDHLFDLDPSLTKPVSSIVEVLRWRATNQPHETGYVYLREGRIPEQRVTYSDLDLSARRIALALSGSASPGDRALLFYPAGKDFLTAFFGCLYAGIVAIPLSLPAPIARFPAWSRSSRTRGLDWLLLKPSEQISSRHTWEA